MQKQTFVEPDLGCNLRPAVEISAGEKNACEEEEVSESGWTMYLDQSIHEYFDSSFAKSLIEFEQEAKNRKNGHAYYQQKFEEDSSMASDASSGPAQPLEVTSKELILEVGHDELKLTALDVGEMRKPKRRRMEEDGNLLEDTASSPACSFKSGLTENETENKDFLVSSELTENEAQNKDFLGSSELLFCSHDEVDAVNKRLDLLHSMLPEAPVSREETLGVAIKYISALEQRIKFHQVYEGKDKSKDSNIALPERDTDGECAVLRERGLCLVPISMLRSAI